MIGALPADIGCTHGPPDEPSVRLQLGSHQLIVPLMVGRCRS